MPRRVVKVKINYTFLGWGGIIEMHNLVIFLDPDPEFPDLFFYDILY